MAQGGAIAQGSSVIAQNTINMIGSIRGLELTIIGLIGLFLFIGGLMTLNKSFANKENQQNISYARGISQLVAGVFMLQIVLITTVFSLSLFGNGFEWVKTPTAKAANGQGVILASAVAMWLQVIGIAMMAKGITMGSDIGKNQDATWGKAGIHFVGGVLLANIFVTTSILSGFTGFNNPFVLLGIA